MKVYLHNRKDIKVFQDGKPLKIYYKGGVEYVEPQVGSGGYFELNFIKKSEFSGGLWFVRALLFWIVGIMGFFTPRYAKCVHSLDCKMRAKALTDSDAINVSFIHPNPRYGVGAGVKVREESVSSLNGDSYIVDKKAAKRKRLYTLLSAVLRLAVIALVIALIIKTAVG